MPLVLVSNDANASSRYQWRDVTGVQYHYPNGYRNLIRPGERFVYYRGMRRADGSRGVAEYFGCGVVGDIWRDPDIPETAPKRSWAWYCSIGDYVPFDAPVPAKQQGTFFENIQANLWRNGVRRLQDETLDAILKAAGLANTPQEPTRPAPGLPRIEDVTIPEVEAELLAPARARSASDERSEPGTSRYSRQALLVGNRAEAVALRWAEREFPNSRIRWVAQEGETPGWDIEVIGPGGEVTALEVKGTSGAGFMNFELTEGELRASRRLGERYLLVLVAECLGASPGMVLSPLPDRTRSRLRAGPLQAKNSRCSMSQGDHFRDEQFCTALP